jgi:cytochrome c biogenesis protein CcmG/thiol:disulfide interchange protein DsbE
VPETYVIDRTGKIRYRQAGPITPEDMKEKIAPLLAALKR